MIDQLSGRTKTVILARFVGQEGGQSYLHLGRISAQWAAGAFHALHNESFETVVDNFPGSIVVCDYALPPGDLDGETGGAERTAVTVKKLPAKKDLDPSVPILVPLFSVFHKDQDAFKKKILESNANAKDCILLRWENGHEGTRADMYSVARQGLTGHGYVEKKQPRFRHVFFLDAKSQRENTMILSRFDNTRGRRQEVRKYNDRSLRLDFVRIPLEEVRDAWQDSLKDEMQ